jgi:hypothetical protein
MSSIREIIQSHQNEILKGNLVPSRAAEILNELSAVLGNLNDEITKRDIEYNKVLLVCYDKEETANRAKIQANITPEYESMRTARNTKELAVELIRSLKYYLRSSEQEMREAGRFQQ